MKMMEFLEKISTGNSTNEQDDEIICKMARVLGYPLAVATCGIIYLDGTGTIENPPIPIQSFAGALIEKIHSQGGNK